jgi:hypothetical protein
VGSTLDDDEPTRSQQTCCRAQQVADHVETVGATEEGDRRLVVTHLRLGRGGVFGDVGRVCHDDIDSAGKVRQGRTRVGDGSGVTDHEGHIGALVVDLRPQHLDVLSRPICGCRVDLDSGDLRPGHFRGEGEGERC